MRDFSILKKRILQFIESKGITKYKFYQETGIANGILSQKNGLTEENIERFLSTYPDVSTEWFFRGSGEMLLTESVNKNVSKTEKCKQPTDMEKEKEKFYRRLEEMEKREESRDFVLRDIADTLKEIKKELKDLHESQERENHSSMCG